MYNREKTLAIVTGIVCALIFLCGTVLGSLHSIQALGALGALSVACYLICDVAVAWAAYIDYQEDGNAMEWTAWVVKYALSGYLLFSGGCIAYLMIKERSSEAGTNQRAALYQQNYEKCIASGSKAGQCRAMARDFNQGESARAADAQAKKESDAGVIEDYVNFPLFKYLPGLLGLAGLFGLTLVSKLQRQQHAPASLPLPMMATGARVRASSSSPPLRHVATYPSVSNGQRGAQRASIRFRARGSGVVLWLRLPGGAEKYIAQVSPPEASVLSTLDFSALAVECGKLNPGLAAELRGLV